MVSRARFAVLGALTVTLVVGIAAQAPAAKRPGGLVAFGSCADLLGYAKAQAARFVTSYGLGQRLGVAGGPKAPGVAAAPSGSVPQQGIDYSGTNVQEAGVDEPDIVKTDGVTLFTVENGRLEAVSVAGARPKLLDTLNLDGGWSHELLLSGTHLLVLSRGGYWVPPLPAATAAMIAPVPSRSTLTEVDISDSSALRVVQTLTLDGAYLDARMIGQTVRVVSTSPMPIELPYAAPSGATAAALADAESRNRAVIASSRVSAEDVP